MIIHCTCFISFHFLPPCDPCETSYSCYLIYRCLTSLTNWSRFIKGLKPAAWMVGPFHSCRLTLRSRRQRQVSVPKKFVFLQFLSPLYDDKSKTLLWCQLSVLQPGFPSIVDSLHLQKVQKHTIASVFLLPKYIFVVVFHFQWVLVSVVVMYRDNHLTYFYFCRAWSVLDQHGLGPPAEERVIANLDRVWKRHASTPRRFL